MAYQSYLQRRKVFIIIQISMVIRSLQISLCGLWRKSNSSIGQSPSDATSSSASQEIPRILRNPKVHYRIHKRPTTCPYPKPDKISPCPRPTHFLKIHLRLGLPRGFLPSGVPPTSCIHLAPSLIRASHSSWFHHPVTFG